MMDSGCTISKQDIVKLMKKYQEARKQCQWVEKNRPSFLKTGLRGLSNYMDIGAEVVCREIDGKIMSVPDKNILKNYVRGKEIMSIVETAIHERIGKAHLPIAEDIFLEGMTVKDTAEKYGINERTVRRVRDRGINAISEEITLLIGTGIYLSNIFK